MVWCAVNSLQRKNLAQRELAAVLDQEGKATCREKREAELPAIMEGTIKD